MSRDFRGAITDFRLREGTQIELMIKISYDHNHHDHLRSPFASNSPYFASQRNFARFPVPFSTLNQPDCKYHFMRHPALLVVALFFLGLSSCKKDSEPAPEFISLNAGSTWTYQPNTGAAYTLTVTSKDTTAMGKVYKVISSSNGANNYWARSGNEYYRFASLPQLGINGFDELYLKDNQPVNTNWKLRQPITVPTIPLPLTATLSYTIKEKDITRTVSGKAFEKVIHVNLEVSVGGLGTMGGGDYYYADHVGLIESSLLLAYSGTQLINRTEVLTSYTIK
jgi:hypothetical protein